MTLVIIRAVKHERCEKRAVRISFLLVLIAIIELTGATLGEPLGSIVSVIALLAVVFAVFDGSALIAR
ncbi:MAG: hypothetical protein ACOY0T_37550 [Myxococcota bacterium]